MTGCECVYCEKAKYGCVDYVAAVVGMTEEDAHRFLMDHRVMYTIIRRDRKHPSMMKCLNYSLYIEIGGEHVIAAYDSPPKWDDPKSFYPVP